jgi:hypothetical protein
VEGYKSTYALLLGEPTLENQTLAGEICARYCDEKDLKILTVKIWSNSSEECRKMEVSPLKESLVSSMRV